MKTSKIFYSLLKNKIKTNSKTLPSLVFYVLVVMLFSISLGVETSKLEIIAPSVIWVAFALSALMVLDNIYAELKTPLADYYLRSVIPMPLLNLSHIAVHWIVAMLPLLVLMPLQLVLLNVPLAEWVYYFTGLIPGSIIFCLLGSMIAALNLTTKKGTLLTCVLLLPLFLPVLILGISIITLGTAGYEHLSPVLWLWGMVCLLLPVAPWLSANILEMSLKR